jgi:hypothetical protein
VEQLIVEAIITLILVSALIYVTPGVFSAVVVASPKVVGTGALGYNATNATANGAMWNEAMYASQNQIGATMAGGLNLTAISVIMLGIGIMLAGFMYVRSRGGI